MKALLLIPLLLTACGSPIVPGQRAQSCVNAVLGSDAPPPQYVQVRRSELPPGYDAWFDKGVVTVAGKVDARLAAHEAVRQVGYHEGRIPTEAEFHKAERKCGGKS